MTEYAWFDRGDGRQVYRKVGGPAPKRSHLATPMVMTDTMDPTEHPCDGRHYTSKAAFRATTKAHGCIEVGNDPARLRPRTRSTPDKKAIRDSLDRAFAKARA